MCIEAAQAIIDRKLYARLGIPATLAPVIERTWNAEPPALYGRMDLAFGADGVPKLLEYNADTPTSLLEAAVIQWSWLEDVFPRDDQFNSIHEKLIAKWKDVAPYLPHATLRRPRVHFGHMDSLEDAMTIGYLRDTAEQAGLRTKSLAMRAVGFERSAGAFVDEEGEGVDTFFKLYPWEWIFRDDFGVHVGQSLENGTVWMEPVWKMLLSSKGILAVLWELFPGHPNLLPAWDPATSAPLAERYVRKPMHGREGANVSFVGVPEAGTPTDGPYAAGDFVCQAYTDLGEHDGYRPVLGLWLVDQDPAGLGIRETFGHVTDDTARFVPHVMRG
jgi:glutathionylspermidine synthase